MPGLRVWGGVEWVVDKALGGEYSPGGGHVFYGLVCAAQIIKGIGTVAADLRQGKSNLALRSHLGSSALKQAGPFTAMPLLPSARWPAAPRRLRTKTTVVQVAVVGVETGPEADSTKGREVYLVSLSHPRATHSAYGRELIPPERLSRGEVLDNFVASCNNPVYLDARSIQAARVVPLKYVSVFRELHKETADGVAHAHYHIGVVAERAFMFLPVKRALLNRGLATHWSTSHDGYWSIIRYLWWPTPPKKPDGAIDKQAIKWAAPGHNHPDFDDLCNPPLTAQALAAKRRKQDREAADNEEEAPRLTELDVWPIVVKEKIRNTPDDSTAHLQLIAWAKQHGTESMQKFLFKNRARLPALIEDIWQWEEVESSLPAARMSRMEALKAAAAGECKCGGQWARLVKLSFDLNGIDARALCSDILAALENGRCPTTPVLVLAGSRGGEGKSALLKALVDVFGVSHVFLTPHQKNFPLMGLPGKKVAFLDEWRFNDAILAYPEQMQWFEGSQLTISRPQNIPGTSGHITYEGTAPILVTTKLADLKLLEELAQDDPTTGQPKNAEASMMWRRLRVHHFCTKIPKPAATTPYCGRCFSKLMLSRGVAAEHGLWQEDAESYFL